MSFDLLSVEPCGLTFYHQISFDQIFLFADGPKLEERQRLARERREERARYMEQRTQQQAEKRAQWLEKEVRARQQREKQLEERKKRLEEQRLRAERRRALLQEKERQQLEKNKERYEAAVRRSAKKTWAEIRQLRWSWAGGLNQTSSRETRSLQLSARESRLVERLMTPTLSFLARSRSSTTLLNSSKDSPLTDSCLRSHSASPLTACTHKCVSHRQVSASTPDIRQRPRQPDPSLEEKKNKKENKWEKALEKGKEPRQRRSLKQRVEPSTLGGKPWLTPSSLVSPSGPKTRTKRSKTPTRVQLQVAFPETVKTIRQSRQPINLKASTPAQASSPPGSRPTAGTTDPVEATRSLAEKRRQVREERERDEQERCEQKERNWEEESRCVAEEQQPTAQQLQAAQEKRDLLQRIKEEEAAEARAEEAERQREERNKHFQREEEERMERKKGHRPGFRRLHLAPFPWVPRVAWITPSNPGKFRPNTIGTSSSATTPARTPHWPWSLFTPRQTAGTSWTSTCTQMNRMGVRQGGVAWRDESELNQGHGASNVQQGVPGLVSLRHRASGGLDCLGAAWLWLVVRWVAWGFSPSGHPSEAGRAPGGSPQNPNSWQRFASRAS
ncbi:hypothetical protein JZ751_024031, partial [Albula glossodonta]